MPNGNFVGEQVGRPRQLELHDRQSEARMTLEDAGEDQMHIDSAGDPERSHRMRSTTFLPPLARGAYALPARWRRS
jgi:hypothetical protein